MQRRLPGAPRVGSLSDLRRFLDHYPPSDAATLDLVAHGNRGHRLLRLGKDVIDFFNPAVAKFFTQLAVDGVLQRLNIHALRLLGCDTAATENGRYALRVLSWTLGIPVYGSTKPLMKSHFGPHGFEPAFERSCLVEASQLPRQRLTG
jgi:hypothetical protein